MWPSNLSTKNPNLAKLLSAHQAPYPHLPRDHRMNFVFIWSTFFCLIKRLASLQSLFQVASTLEPTLQSQVSAKHYRCWVKVFLSLPFLWLVVVVEVGKITKQEFLELDCSVQLRYTKMYGDWLIGWQENLIEFVTLFNDCAIVVWSSFLPEQVQNN